MKLTCQQIGSKHREEQVAGKESDPDEGCLCKQSRIALDVRINLVLCFKVRNNVFSSRDLLPVGERTPDVMLECWGCCSCFCEVDALGGLDLHCFFRPLGCEGLEEIGDGEDESSSLLSSMQFSEALL